MLKINGKVYRNLQEQVAQNMNDITELKKHVPYEDEFYTREESDAKYQAKADMSEYATKEDLEDYAKTTDLADYAKTTDLADYAKTTDLADYVPTSSIATKYFHNVSVYFQCTDSNNDSHRLTFNFVRILDTNTAFTNENLFTLWQTVFSTNKIGLNGKDYQVDTSEEKIMTSFKYDSSNNFIVHSDTLYYISASSASFLDIEDDVQPILVPNN